MKYRVIKMSDMSQCGCCGRSGLKRTVHLEMVETGDEVFFGVNCAANALRQKYQGKNYRVSAEAIKNMAHRVKTEGALVVLESV
jgi:predicted metal-binding protein